VGGYIRSTGPGQVCALVGDRSAERVKLFRRSGVDSIDIRIDQSYVNPLVSFFRLRERRW